MMFLTFLVCLTLAASERTVGVSYDEIGFCSEEQTARGCKVYKWDGECICPDCMEGLVDIPKMDSHGQSTLLKCQMLAFDYMGGGSYAWGNGDGCYTYLAKVDVKTAKATSGTGKWITCSPPKVAETEEAVGCDNYCMRMTGSADYCGCTGEAAVGASKNCRVPKGRQYNLPRESGMCDRGKDYKAWDSCNYCVRGSRWVGTRGLFAIGNHWCCTEDDLQNGDCECTVKNDEEAVGCDNYCMRMTGSADYCGCTGEEAVGCDNYCMRMTGSADYCGCTDAEAAALAYTTARSGHSWITYGLAAFGVGTVLYGAGSFYLKK